MNPIKPTVKTEIIPVLGVAAAVISSFYFYAHFPERVPMHWNAAGEIDGWGSRWVGAFLIPIVILGMYLLFLGIPYLDPKKDRYEQFRKVYHVFKGFIVTFMAIIYFLTSFSALGGDINIGLWVPGMVGVLFILLGNYMGKIKPNWFMGIRTPWTLSSEEVWNKTHRFGGKIFMLAGLVFLAMNWMPVSWRAPLFMADMIFILLGTVVYSYVVYLLENKKNRTKNSNNTKY
ncbi:MAG: SdpI family protein [Candidatus Falkowbacteria bacterium]